MAHLALTLHIAVRFLEIDAQSSAVKKKPSPNVKAKSTDTPFTETYLRHGFGETAFISRTMSLGKRMRCLTALRYDPLHELDAI